VVERASTKRRGKDMTAGEQINSQKEERGGDEGVASRI
jgi:hypothetical protein